MHPPTRRMLKATNIHDRRVLADLVEEEGGAVGEGIDDAVPCVVEGGGVEGVFDAGEGFVEGEVLQGVGDVGELGLVEVEDAVEGGVGEVEPGELEVLLLDAAVGFVQLGFVETAERVPGENPSG